MSTFAERVKELRIENRYKQREMAALLKLSLGGYQCYEYGKGYPEIPVLIAMADFFHVSVDYLLGRTDNREINR